MALATTFESLRLQLRMLKEAVSALQVTVTEDKPARGEAALVDQLDNAICDLLGAVQEAEAVAAPIVGKNLTIEAGDQNVAALREINTLFNGLAQSYFINLAAHSKVALLIEMGREKGGPWAAWCRAVKMSIDSCAAPLRGTADALLQCWSELSERLARQSVSVQSTNIGQQISVREDQFELAGKAA